MSQTQKLNLATEAGDGINGTAWTDEYHMIAAVREKYGDDCHLAISDGFILDGQDQIVATFGRE